MKQIKSKYNLRSRKAVESVNPTTQQVGHANSHPTMGYWGKYMQKIGSILDIPVSCSYNASMYPDLLLNQPKIQVRFLDNCSIKYDCLIFLCVVFVL